MPKYDAALTFCRQCKADLIGPPEARRCGTCGLPEKDPPEAAAPKKQASPTPLAVPRAPEVQKKRPTR